MDEKTKSETELREKYDRKRETDKKYYQKKKLRTENEIPKINSEPIINKVECVKEIKPPEIKTQEINTQEIDWGDWAWNTAIGAIQMMSSTIIQTVTTLPIPVILAMIIPRPASISYPQQLKQEEPQKQQQITSLNML